MGTRGAWGFRIDGKDKVSYNHYDSYPEWLGVTLIKGIKAEPLFTHADGLEALKYRVRMINLLTCDDDDPIPPPIRKDIAAFLGKDDFAGHPSWYGVLPRADRLDYYLQPSVVFMIDSQTFLNSSLYCEYAYILNFDTCKLEYYEGYNELANLKRKGRYAQEDHIRLSGSPDDGEFGPVYLVKEFTFKSLIKNKLEDIKFN